MPGGLYQRRDDSIIAGGTLPLCGAGIRRSGQRTAERALGQNPHSDSPFVRPYASPPHPPAPPQP